MTETPTEEETPNAAILNPTWQTKPVDTTGLGGLPDLSTVPIFAQHKADTLQGVIDELSGDAPAGSSGYTVDPTASQEDIDAQIAAFKTSQEQAQAIADGKTLDADGNVVEPEAEPEAAPQAQSAKAPSKPTGVESS